MQVQTLAYTDRAGDMQGTLEIKDSGLPKKQEKHKQSYVYTSWILFLFINLKRK